MCEMCSHSSVMRCEYYTLSKDPTRLTEKQGTEGNRHICEEYTRAATAVIDAAKKHPLDCELEECEIFQTKWC